MERDLARLSNETFDVVVIGGGIHGACAAWDACLRGLSVALVEKNDLCSGTSANSLKTIHGGLRYLQQGDVRRMRESIRERSLLMRLAPHLVRPLPVLVPIYGGLTTGRAAFRVALALTDLIGFDRDRIAGHEGLLPAGRVLSRAECLDRFPGFETHGLRGGALWHDGQTRDSERLVLEFLESASRRGTAVANYAEAIGPLTAGDRLVGVRVRDGLGGDTFDLRARTVLAATGPWTARVIEAIGGTRTPPAAAGLALAINVVVGRRVSDCAIGIRSRRDRARDPVAGGHRYLFLAPWRESTLVGTAYTIADSEPDPRSDLTPLLEDLVRECNEACPALGFTADDVTYFHWGLLPLRGEGAGPEAVGLAGRPTIVGRAEHGGPANLIGMVGVKYTTARRVARDGVDAIVACLDRAHAPCSTDREPLVGTPADGEISPPVPHARLAERYGAAWKRVAHDRNDPDRWTRPVSARTPVLACEVSWAVRHEMARNLTDVVLRRTDLGSERCPDRATLAAVSELMGDELGWTDRRRRDEIEDVIRTYAPLPSGRPETADV